LQRNRNGPSAASGLALWSQAHPLAAASSAGRRGGVGVGIPLHSSPGEKDLGSISQRRLWGKRGPSPSASRRGGGRQLYAYTSNHISGMVCEPSSWTREMGTGVTGGANLRSRSQGTRGCDHHSLSSPVAKTLCSARPGETHS